MTTLTTSGDIPAQTTNKQRWLYSIANLGNNIPYQAVGAVLLFFYTDVKHLPVTWSAIAMTIYAIYNAFNNPILVILATAPARAGGGVFLICSSAWPRVPSLSLCYGWHHLMAASIRWRW